ncbi:hypothetical protein WUBG_06205 [Wuchereria bancrofti]|uniref:Uncharacterized protein n=1 Tax=Wuchereria bancrofti TaxID=6293 RepID=J9B764_WUCBA|nr:hypothetical protein WUBG_06205 [Wuchereria bancrofti]
MDAIVVGDGNGNRSGGGNGNRSGGAVVVRTVTTESAEISPNQLTHSSLSSFPFTPFCLLGIRGMGWTKLMKINQPTNQPINQPNNQPTRLINQPIMQPII